MGVFRVHESVVWMLYVSEAGEIQVAALGLSVCLVLVFARSFDLCFMLRKSLHGLWEYVESV